MISIKSVQWTAAVVCTFVFFMLFEPGLAHAIDEGCDQWVGDAGGLLATECQFVSENDRFLVLDRNKNGKADFEYDVWLFDINANDDAQLVVKFEDESTAYLYDDRDGDGKVAYELYEGEIAVTESDSWTVHVQADGVWQSPDGQPNYNLIFIVDGTPESIYGSVESQNIAKNDGVPDWEYRISDQDDDGIPDYWMFRLLTPFPPSWSLMRFSTFHNLSQTRPAVPAHSFLWPYLWGEELKLSSDDELPYGTRMFEDSPYIDVDWEAAKIITLGFFGYPIEEGWWVNSVAGVNEDETAAINFESPHAWYDLAQDNDRHPELNVRVVHWNANDEHWIKSVMPVNEIRYSWNQANSDGLAFDYKLGLVGTQPIKEEVQLGPYAIAMIPWQELPGWVTDQEWQSASFVAVEGINYQSSEGIYEWAPATSIDGSAENFVTGRDDEPPEKNFKEVRSGMRGEYALQLEDKPYLYISPVDKKLHLVGASEGHWNFGENQILRYKNNVGDFLDEWWLESNDQVQERLLVAGDLLVYASDDKIALKKIGEMIAPEKLLPPANHEDWEVLAENLGSALGESKSPDLAELFSQFAGQEQVIHGATLLDASLAEEGLSVTLRLSPESSRTGSDLIKINDFEPGTYILSYDGQSAKISEFAPVNIVLSSKLRQDNSSFAAQPKTITTQVKNTGLEEATDLLLVAEAQQGDKHSSIATETLTVLSGATSRLIHTWHPTQEGEWQVTITVYDASGESVAMTNNTVLIEPPKPLQVPDMQAEDLGAWLPLVLVLLSLTGAIILSISILQR